MNELQELKVKYDAAKIEHASGVLSAVAFEAICREVGHSDSAEGCCEGCLAPLFSDEPYHHSETSVCADCSPTFQHLIDEPETFIDFDEQEPSDPSLLLAIFDHHIANGGAPSDKLIGEWGNAYNDAQNKRAAAEDMHLALKSSEQCISDFLDIYSRGASMTVFDLAASSLKNDALKLIKAALAKAEGRTNG